LTLRVAHPSSTHRIALISGTLTGPTSKLTWKIKFRSIPELHNEMAIDTCVKNFSGVVLKALAASTPKRRPRADLQASDTGWHSG
jgi:hypothetical protein